MPWSATKGEVFREMTDKDKVPEKIDLNEILAEGDALEESDQIEILDPADIGVGEDETRPLRTPPHSAPPASPREGREESDPYKELWVRARADFENFRKRTEREREEEAIKAGALMMRDLLPVLDNLERALAKAPPGDPFADGVALIHKQLQDALFRAGLRPIEAVGEPFDPIFHEAVVTEPTTAFESNLVLDEIQKGYLFRGRVVRPSLVKVSVRGGEQGGPGAGTLDG